MAGPQAGSLWLRCLSVTGTEQYLVVNDDEARMVPALFGLYLEHQFLIDTDSRGRANKRWVKRKGQESGGKPEQHHRQRPLRNLKQFDGHMNHWKLITFAKPVSPPTSPERRFWKKITQPGIRRSSFVRRRLLSHYSARIRSFTGQELKTNRTYVRSKKLENGKP
jgi:hypothetical protein